ncbi:MAG: hypothetical protein GOU98_00110 [Candidatus Altiarchaeota archaeon]|nr:hypothetical protein [Candidatus Altiarchaeota archaeon]
MIDNLTISEKKDTEYVFRHFPNFPDTKTSVDQYREVSQKKFEMSLYDFSIGVLAEVSENYKIKDHLLLMNAARDIPRGGALVNQHVEDILESKTLRNFVDGLSFLYQGAGDLYNILQDMGEDAELRYTFLASPKNMPLYFPKSEIENLKLSFEHESRYADSNDGFI